MLKYSSRKRLSPAEQRSLGRVPADAGGSRPSPCSLGLSATSQQYFSLTTNQPPATSHQPTEQAAYLLRAGLRAYDQVAKIWRKKKKEF
jgi:hypothetical protein